MLCSICNKTASQTDPPVCDECGGSVAMEFLGRFGTIQKDLEREKLACANLSDRASKASQQHGDEMSRMRRSHTETTAGLKLRIERARTYLMGLRAWPIRRFIDRAVARLDGDE